MDEAIAAQDGVGARQRIDAESAPESPARAGAPIAVTISTPVQTTPQAVDPARIAARRVEERHAPRPASSPGSAAGAARSPRSSIPSPTRPARPTGWSRGSGEALGEVSPAKRGARRRSARAASTGGRVAAVPAASADAGHGEAMASAASRTVVGRRGLAEPGGDPRLGRRRRGGGRAWSAATARRRRSSPIRRRGSARARPRTRRRDWSPSPAASSGSAAVPSVWARRRTSFGIIVLMGLRQIVEPALECRPGRSRPASRGTSPPGSGAVAVHVFGLRRDLRQHRLGEHAVGRDLAADDGQRGYAGVLDERVVAAGLAVALAGFEDQRADAGDSGGRCRRASAGGRGSG